MAVISGRKISYGIGKETTRGTSVAPAYGIAHLDGDFKPRAEKVINDSAIGVLADANDSALVKEWAEGDLTSKFTPDAGGLLLLAGFGNVVTSDNVDANAIVKDHLFTMSENNQHPSFTLVRKEANKNERYALATCRKWEMEVMVGEYVKVTTGWISKKGVTGTDNITYLNDTEFVPKYAALRRAANVAGLTGGTDTKVRRFKVTIEKTVADDYVFGSTSPDDFFVTQYAITGEIELRYETTGEYDLYAGDTKNALRLSLVNTDVTIGTAARPGLVLQMPTISATEWDVDQGKDAVVMQTVGIKGLYDVATAQAIQATLTNTVAAY